MQADATETAAAGQASHDAIDKARGDTISLNLQLLGVYIALVVIALALTLASPYFLTFQNLSNILIEASTLSLIGAGLTIVLIAAEIDLSFATMQAFVGSVAAIVIIQGGLPWPVGIVVAIAIGTLAGVASGVVTVTMKLPTFITTLAMLGITQGAAYLLTNGQPVADFPSAYGFIGNGHIFFIPFPLVIVFVIYVLLYVLLNRTKFGLQVYAVGGSRAAAELVGISWRRIVVAVLALSAFLASISGIIITSRLNAGSGNYGPDDLLPAVAGVIIGGTSLFGGMGTLVGTLGGVLIIVTINDALVLLNVSQFWQQLVVGLIILGAVMIDQLARRFLGTVEIPKRPWRRHGRIEVGRSHGEQT